VNILASKFRQRELDAEHARMVAKIVLEAGVEAPKANPWAMPLDHRRLRCIPAVGRYSAALRSPARGPIGTRRACAPDAVGYTLV
jgi:hypothetical protein